MTMISDIYKELFNVEDKVVIITGGLGLIGSEYVKTFAQAGAKVAIFDISTKVNPTVQKLLEGNFPIYIHQVDITVKNQVIEAVKAVVEKFGTPTILINNAGLDTLPNASASENGPYEDFSEESWNITLDSHLRGMFIVSQEVIKEMKKAGKGGSIINVSSTYGLVAPDQSVYEYRRRNGENYYKPISYSVAKAGVLGFTRWLAEYCAPFSIRVNTLVPGGVKVENHHPEFVKEYSKRTMLGRLAQPDEYSAAVLFLSSDASSYMTGSTMVVDGGWTAR